MRRCIHAGAAGAAVWASLFACGAEGGDDAAAPCGTRLFYRVLGSRTNAPPLPKTRSAWTQDRRETTANTGMADEGFTEYPFCSGAMDFTFVEDYAIYPRLISDARADATRVNTADMVIDRVYEPDGCVWGLDGRELVQTFTATQDELVSATLLVASEPGTFRAALVDGGPGGRPIGPVKTFASGHSMTWGHVRWAAGQAPLVPGRVYGIRMWRADGKKWMPYLHATGDAYAGGMMYVDGRPRPESDMAVWIVEQPPDLRRGLIIDADEEGWVYNASAVRFAPRTPNVRMLWLNVAPVEEECVDLVIRITNVEGALVAGPKRSLACGPAQGPRQAPFLFATDELPVTTGAVYTLEAFAVAHKAPLPKEEDVEIRPRDMQLRVYGEPEPGALPAIFNLTAEFESDSRLRLEWSAAVPSVTTVRTWGPGTNGNVSFMVERGRTRIVIPKLWAGHEYDFTLMSAGPTGMTWRTPRYRVRMPRSDVRPIVQTPPYPPEFVTIAPAARSEAPDYPPVRYRGEAALVNPDFEEGLTGWRAEPDGMLHAPDVDGEGREELRARGASTNWGRRCAGFTHAAGPEREQVFATGTLSQEIATVPGRTYALCAMVRTSVAPGGPRGDTRVRLFAGEAGAGIAAGGGGSSQWYWTDGRWMRFQHRFTAESETTVAGFGFFRWRDLDWASAYVDLVRVYDLGPAPPAPDEGAPRPPSAPSLVLADPKTERWDPVEAFLEAPPGFVITGIGARAHYDNITTMWLKVQPLLPGGALGEPEHLRGGWEADAGLEAQIELPPGYVATGFGAGIAPEWDVKRLRVWARPLEPDGSLGEEREFRGGKDLESGVEREVRIERGRVLTSAGLNCMLNDCNGIRAASARIVQTAAAAAASHRGE
ncbi:MAG TPA: hypothetical protein DCM87_11020 [Planctomycetes bacterium]|nr:hypothetical protein [Planctomycetota bacterium]